MAIRELGNVLGNPLGRAKTLSGGGTDKALVGDLLFAASAPDVKWAAHRLEKLFIDEYPALFKAFGGVLPVTGAGNADTNIANALPTSANSRIAVFGDNADTINGLTIVTYFKTSTTVTTLYFVTLKNGVIDSYTLTVTQSTGTYQPMNLTFTPNGVLMLSGHAAYTGYGYAYKMNATTSRFENIAARSLITSGNSYATTFIDHPVNRSYGNRTGLYGKPTSYYYWNGTAFVYSNWTSLYYNGAAIDPGVMAFSSDGLRTFSMANFNNGSYTYYMFMRYRASLTTTTWSTANMYNGSGTAYVASTWWAQYPGSYKAWFNSDGSKFYITRYSSGYLVDVYALTSAARYDFDHSFSIISSPPTDFINDKYLVIPDGTSVYIYDMDTEALAATVDVSTYFSDVSEAKLSDNYNYLICRGSITAGSPYPSTNVIPILDPLKARPQFTVPNLSSLPATISAQYSPLVPRSVFMKMKP